MRNGPTIPHKQLNTTSHEIIPTDSFIRFLLALEGAAWHVRFLGSVE